MALRFFKPQQHLDLAGKLIQCIQEGYLNLPWYMKWPDSLFTGEEDRAKAYIAYLKALSASTWNEQTVFNAVLRDVKMSGEGRLGASRNLRTLLAEELCQFLGVKKELLIDELRKAMYAGTGKFGCGMPENQLQLIIALRFLREANKRVEGITEMDELDNNDAHSDELDNNAYPDDADSEKIARYKKL